MSQAINYHSTKFRCRGRLGMVKSKRRYAAIAFYGLLTVFLISIGMVEGNTTLNATVMVVTGLLTLLLVFGVELQSIEYRGLRIEFESSEGGDGE